MNHGVKRRRFRISAVTYGVVAALLAVGAQVFFNLQPPPAYAICMTCHPRDMISWIANHLTGTTWEIAPVSASWPLLTTLGLLAGAWLAARQHGEVRRVSLGRRGVGLLCGLLAMNAGLVALGCPTRLVLFTAYGDGLALVGTLGVAIGVLAGTWLLRRGVWS